jgi:hypothetical protein
MNTEPVALFAAIAVVVVWGASLFGVVLDTGAIENALISGVFVITAILQRSKVTPA